MKTIYQYSLCAMALLMGASLSSCGDFEPTGYDPVPDLPTVSNLKAEIARHDINLSWQLPSSDNISDVEVILNGNTGNPIKLGAAATSYTVVGQPLGEERFFTVKVCYGDKYVSEGVSVSATLPEETFAGVTNVETQISGRKVTVSWTLPNADGVTGSKVYREDEPNGAVTLPLGTDSYTFKSQPMDQELKYCVEAVYDTYYTSAPQIATATVPHFDTKMAYLLTAPTWQELPDDDERAAAEWFSQQENAEFVTIDQIPNLDSDIYPVVWIEIDRVGIGMGWQNLPAEVSSEASIAILKNYTANGGNLYLSNMATQLTVPLDIVPENMGPSIFGDGDGGSGDDVWTIVPYLGYDFRPGGPRAGEQGYYDRTDHAIFKDLTFSDPNGWDLPGLPLIGPGQREDHNCMWELNQYGSGEYKDVIANFEATTGSLVLATWAHVRDHCVAGLVDFFPNANHGRCVANGFAAYEWNQNSGANPYQHNVEQLTKNILDYLK